jgi:hypothetical protein
MICRCNAIYLPAQVLTQAGMPSLRPNLDPTVGLVDAETRGTILNHGRVPSSIRGAQSPRLK